MTDFAGLLARVREAKGPDRHLDALIIQALTPNLHDAFADHVGFIVGGNHEQPTRAPELTASIDAALALVERMLPGWRLCIEGEPGGSADDCYLLGPEYRSDGSRPDQSSPATAAATWPLAILTALLRALSSPTLNSEDK